MTCRSVRPTRRRTACCASCSNSTASGSSPPTPVIGYMHRGFEKLAEHRDFRQIIALVNRHDWLSGFTNELGRRARGRADARDGGPGARPVDPHADGRVEPDPQPPDVRRLVRARARRHHPDVLRLPRARGHPAPAGVRHRRAPALHLQPGRAASRSTCRRASCSGRVEVVDARPQAHRRTTTTCCSATRSSRAAPRASGRCRTEVALSLRRVTGPTLQATGVPEDVAGHRALPQVRRDRRAGPRRRERRHVRPLLLPAGRIEASLRHHRPGPRPHPAGAGQHQAAEDGQGARGLDLRAHREPARAARLLARVRRRPHPVAAEDAHAVVLQRPGASRTCSRGRCCPTPSPSSARVFFVVGDIDR